MPKISAEFPDHATKNMFAAFRDFLRKMQAFRGYRKEVQPDGTVIHFVDFEEADLNEISGVWGKVLETRWQGTYFIDGKPVSYNELWRRELRTDKILDTARCPVCKTPVRNMPANLGVRYDPKTGETQMLTLCRCGNDVTDLVNTAHAIATAKSAPRMLRKARGEE